MWPFSQSQAVTVAPEPTVDHYAELLEEFRRVEDELATLNSEIGEFRRTHALQTDYYQRIIRMKSASMNGFASVDREWRLLRKRADVLYPKRNTLLQELARLKVPEHA